MEEENKKNLLIKILGGIIVIATILLTYGFTLGTKGLKIKEYSVLNKNISNNFHGFKIVHFSDLHYGRTINKNNIKKIIDSINELEPDIVVFTGDLVDRDVITNREVKTTLIENLSNIESKYGNYFVSGNHDKVNKSFYDIMEESNFINLEKTTETIYNNLDKITITGIKSTIEKKPNVDWIKEQELSDYNILLMHVPDNIQYIEKNKFDLVLAGHSHNGQVRLPLIGKIITPQGAKIYYNEYYKVNKTDLYISSGIGTSKLNIRLFNKPSINFYRLVNK